MIFPKIGTITNEFYAKSEGYQLHEQHTFRLNLPTDVDKYITIRDEGESPPNQSCNDLGNL